MNKNILPPFLWRLKYGTWMACAIILCLSAFTMDPSPGDPHNEEIFLIVRADDMGISQSTNQAVIESYRNGIVTSVEVLVPGPWFLDAVELLREHPDLDVGLHLTLTSEWSRLKWRPISTSPSLVDSNGYLLPVIWEGTLFSEDQVLRLQDWTIEDVEQELRAQIEMGLTHIPDVSHISCHMGFQSLSPRVDELLISLAKEYQLIYKTELDRLDFKKDRNADSYVPAFLNALEKVGPGKYLFVEHPALDGPEMRSVYMASYLDVATDRQKVTDLFLDERVKTALGMKKITLMSYKDLENVGK